MDMWEELASLVPKSRIDECYIAYRPWLKDKTHHYVAFLRYYPKGSKRNSWGHRDWSYVRAMADDPHDAIHKAEAELLLRKDR